MTYIEDHIQDDLKLESYHLHVPPHLVAERPLPDRQQSRLMVYEARADKVTHSHFYRLQEFLPPDHLLVLNQSRVFPSRLLGKKSTGGEAQLFFLSPFPARISPHGDLYEVLIRATGKRKVGDKLLVSLQAGGHLQVVLRVLGENGTFLVSVDPASVMVADLLEREGLIPIPPYVRKGVSDERDRKDYQTVYGRDVGSVAAPTAGLHFTPELLQQLGEKGIDQAYITLHVGLGTFAPIKSSNIVQHRMHRESFHLSPEAQRKIAGNWGKIVAVGTTSLRTLESCTDEAGNFVAVGSGSTDIFLHPGKKIRSVQGLVTNFHLPQSTLLLLVSSLLGRKKTLELYQEAIAREYRFYSYGDAMLILL